MLYQQKSFTLPASNKRMTTEEWEIRVGLRCPQCKEKRQDCKCGA